MKYHIRAIKESEYNLLNDFLYEAIFIPKGMQAPSKTILLEPELQLYVAGFGKEVHDKAFVAEIADEVIGAIWVRIMKDYGHIDEDTPSLAISLFKEYRGQGIGEALMKKMLSTLKIDGYCQVSLAVQKENYAVKMYLKLGFEILLEKDEEYIMVNHLQ